MPRGLVDLHMCKDVYATSFVLANNATPDMYSFFPWRNRAMWRAWFYLGFIASSQLFVLYALLCVFPIVVKSKSFFVDCDHPTAEAVAALEPHPRPTLARYLLRLTLEARYLLRLVTEEGEGGEGDAQLDQGAGGGDGGGAFSAAVRAHCLRQSIAIEAYAPDGGQGGSRHMRYRTLEAETMFHENIFNVESWYMYLLQFTCCVWVTTHVYFVDLKNVCNLLEFRDFNRWLLPLKGEQLPQNTWVLLIPAMQLLLCTAVASVSCCITCGFTDAVDIVLNSLAFTFIAKVAELFNEPLLHAYSKSAIDGLGPEYGTAPIYYLVGEYDETNSYGPSYDNWVNSWYVRQQDRYAGLLTDFHIRHTPEDYPRPWYPRIKALKRTFAALPLASVLLTWAFFTPMPCFRC